MKINTLIAIGLAVEVFFYIFLSKMIDLRKRLRYNLQCKDS